MHRKRFRRLRGTQAQQVSEQLRRVLRDLFHCPMQSIICSYISVGKTEDISPQTRPQQEKRMARNKELTLMGGRGLSAGSFLTANERLGR